MIRTERIRTFDAEDKYLHEKRQALEQCETGLEMSLTASGLLLLDYDPGNWLCHSLLCERLLPSKT